MLRNAFEGMLTERTGRLILAAVNYARDINDRMRVVVDNQVSTTIAAGPYLHGAANSTTATYQLWNGNQAVFTMDQREQQRLDSLQAGMQARARWTYS